MANTFDLPITFRHAILAGLLLFAPFVSAQNELPTTGCEGTSIVAPAVPCATYNLSVLSIDQQVYRMVQEMQRSQSSRVTAYSLDDKERIDSYYAQLVAIVNQTGSTIMDYHGLIQYELSPLLDTIHKVENEATNTALQYLVSGVANLRISQSARLNDGLLPNDMEDFLDIVAKSKLILDDLYNSFNPVDMPQSNPSQGVTTPTSTAQ